MNAIRRLEMFIDIERIFLDLSNPRHEPFQTREEAIQYLCKHENVLQLARDIKRHGLNPLERFAVTRQDGGTKDTRDTAYVVAEGNRRLCALMLLNDSELAPRSQSMTYEKLAEGWAPIERVPCVIFEDQEDLDLWLARTHQGPQGGIGRKDWDARQKQRHSGSNKNRVALAFLEYGAKKGMITAEQQRGKLTTIQRYVGNPVVRAALGIDASDPEEVSRTKAPEDFELLAGKFFGDLLSNDPKITSRSDKREIEAYAAELTAIDGQSRQLVDPIPILEDEKPARKPNKPRPTKNISPKKLPFNSEVSARLKLINSWKLQHLYNSICSIPLQENTPLLAVGVWSFIECLTARADRKDGTDFVAFLSVQRLQQYGLGDRTKTRSIRHALERVQKFGNSTKHDDTAASFNGDQLANDVETLGPLFIKCAEEAALTKS